MTMTARLKSTLCACAAALGTGSASAQEITIGELDWTGALAVQRVLEQVMEERLGLDVEAMAAREPIIFAAMDKGDGSIDVAPDEWIPNVQGLWDEYIAEGSKESVLVNNRPYSGIQGFFIPGYLQDEHGITHVDQLKDPEVAALFDSNDDDRGDWWPGSPGWETTNTNLVKARSYGFDEHFDPYIVSDAIMKAQLKSQYAKGEGFMIYGWTPDWLHARYDLRRLEEPAFDGFAMESEKGGPLYNADGCWEMYQPEETPDWLEESRVACEWPEAQVYVAYAKALEERVPEAAQFLKQVYFDPNWVNDWIAQIELEDRVPADVAEEWVAANPEVVDEWLKGIDAASRD